MSRSMKFVVAAVVGATAVSLMAPEDAEARARRFRRFRTASYGYNTAYGYNAGYGHGGACGCAPVSACAPVSTCAPVSACSSGCQTGACGIATSACSTGGCQITGGTIGYSGGYSAGYGSSVQGYNHSNMPPAPQGSFDQPPLPPSSGATFRGSQELNGEREAGSLNDGASSPSDRAAPPQPDQNGSSALEGQSDRSAPPPPPSQGE